MSAPTPAQLKLLKVVHRQATLATQAHLRATTRQAETGEPPSTAWYQDFADHGRLRQELANIARTVGIPAEWIALCEKRGELRQPWKNALHWREPETAVDRHRAVARLEQEVRRFQKLVAVVAVHGDRAARAEVGTARMVERRLHVGRRWIGALADVLEITADEAERLWGHASWQAAADHVRTAEADELHQRWRHYARGDLTGYRLQAQVLLIAGFDVDTTGLPTLAEMAETVTSHLSHTAGSTETVPGPGIGIENAIDTAGIGTTTDDSPESPPPAVTQVLFLSAGSEVDP